MKVKSQGLVRTFHSPRPVIFECLFVYMYVCVWVVYFHTVACTVKERRWLLCCRSLAIQFFFCCQVCFFLPHEIPACIHTYLNMYAAKLSSWKIACEIVTGFVSRIHCVWSRILCLAFSLLFKRKNGKWNKMYVLKGYEKFNNWMRNGRS